MSKKDLLLFLNIQKAFDSVQHDIMERIAHAIFPHGKFASRRLRHTNRGEAMVSIGTALSESFVILEGVGQGDPSSSFKYLLVHDVFLGALHSDKLRHLEASL